MWNTSNKKCKWKNLNDKEFNAETETRPKDINF